MNDRRILRAILALVCLAVSQGAGAQAWPAKPIRLVASAAPGGITDQIARAMAAALSGTLGQSVVVENKPGGNQVIGADFVAKSAPDGYTFLVTEQAALVANRSLYAKLPFDVRKDFAPVVGYARALQALAVHPSVPAQSLKEFVELIRARPREITYATVGAGSAPHLNMELLSAVTGGQMTAVAYKGAGPAITDLIAGHVQSATIAIGLLRGHAQAGKLRVLALGGSKRWPGLPDVPTSAEAGVPEFDAGTWFGVMAPAGTPEAVVNRLNSEINTLLADERYREENLSRRALEPLGGTPAEFGAFIEREYVKWDKIIKQAGIRLE